MITNDTTYFQNYQRLSTIVSYSKISQELFFSWCNSLSLSFTDNRLTMNESERLPTSADIAMPLKLFFFYHLRESSRIYERTTSSSLQAHFVPQFLRLITCSSVYQRDIIKSEYVSFHRVHHIRKTRRRRKFILFTFTCRDSWSVDLRMNESRELRQTYSSCNRKSSIDFFVFLRVVKSILSDSKPLPFT